MLLKVSNSQAGGRVRIPGSKSQTIRALFLASLAQGRSETHAPLISSDTLSAVTTCQAFGARIIQEEQKFTVEGINGLPQVPQDIIQVGNSGTTLRFGVMTAALCDGYTVFTGDEQIRSRPLGPLLTAICDLGGIAFTTRDNGSAPAVIKGRVHSGAISVDAVTSQYLSALLIHAPLLDGDTTIRVTRLNEAPYVDMTLGRLDGQRISYDRDGYRQFTVKGGQHYQAFRTTIPGDFSSATFLMVQAAISGSEMILENLDLKDTQGDKAILPVLESMGANVTVTGDTIRIVGNGLKGREIDLNAIPDALPALAVAGCFASGETRLVNVPQARLKETDRIRVMAAELVKMGADITELPDGLVIKSSSLKGCFLNGHSDHRVVMALAIAGLNASGITLIDSAEAVRVTFPEFVDIISACGGKIRLMAEG